MVWGIPNQTSVGSGRLLRHSRPTTQLPPDPHKEHNTLFFISSPLSCFHASCCCMHVLQMDNALYEELDIWLNDEPPRQEETVWKSPKHDESLGPLSNQGSFTHDFCHLAPTKEIPECYQKSPEKRVLDDQKREDADEKSVPTVLWLNSQPDQMDQSMSRSELQNVMNMADISV